jgi:hypothetical protein
MNDRHTMQVSARTWKKAQAHYKMSNPASRLRELLDRVAQVEFAEPAPFDDPISDFKEPDYGTPITAKYKTMCTGGIPTKAGRCGRWIDIGDNAVLFTDADGKRKCRCEKCQEQLFNQE